MLHDHQQRDTATDPTQSFIVQAPAGSGKTEILTQRFLRLLHQVQAPEQIIALTFTRKAANEMRERILLAMHQVAEGVEPHSAHQRTTHHYARQALERDQELGWHLLQQSSRLRIMTIDALCQMITHAIPLHSNHYATITEYPKALYWEAARAYVRSASYEESQQADLQLLLQHLDNRQDLLIALFAQVLAQRDQWLTPMFMARAQSKTQFEEALAWIEHHELLRFRQTLPQDIQGEVFTLVTLLVQHCGLDDEKYRPLQEWQHFDTLNAEQATALAAVLLTSTQSLRKGFDHHIGLKRGVCTDDIYTLLKTRSKALLAALSELPDFEAALVNVSHLPKPEFAPNQWAVLQALFHILPVLVAYFELQCHSAETIDFTGVAHQARLALGEEDSPTDLALYLDHRIQHMLIDEFQDTSLQQFELITQLIQGWEPNDGRTLFVVGDPMQSIYRFRAAEVGLFLRAQAKGIGAVRMHPLSLSTNFRSTTTLVEWVNHHFQTIFPPRDDIESGAVSFHVSAPLLENHAMSFVKAYQYDDSASEATEMINVIMHELETHPNSSLAILVRSRAQLRPIIALLRKHQIPFQGVDIDLLAHLPHLRDIWSLTQAFLMPANRLAWLAFLRSPWCGLSLADLLVLAQDNQSIYVALSHAQNLSKLSEEGRARAQYIYTVLHQALLHRHQCSLVRSLLQILNHLHLDRILTPTQQHDLEQYWSLLSQFEIDGQISDFKLLYEQFNALYSKKVTPARLQIMTIHKSKGLEFDCVMLPGLGAKPFKHDQALMRWLKLPRHQEEDLFLLSPIKAAAEDKCRVYDYLGRLDAQKSFYESQRLLYVAVTRAKQRLYLFDHHSNIRQKSFRHMLQHHGFTTPDTTTLSPLTQESPTPILWRLPLTYYQDLSRLTATTTSKNTALTLPSSMPRLLGIVTHEMLQWICTYHPKDPTDIPWQLAKDHLKTMGFAEADRSSALSLIQEQIHAFLNDPKGQWIAQPHREEHNEYELLIPQGTRIIDRTFIEHKIRWIIDFKTGKPDQDTLEAHQTQLNHYAEIFQENPRLLIRCGLYYLTNLQWIEWEPTTCKT
ncbi:MAG: ATP-dependent DNA helicase [Legionella sp.]|nr:MAG: ATP-dependent DNA helicase [Legionella sp.]